MKSGDSGFDNISEAWATSEISVDVSGETKNLNACRRLRPILSAVARRYTGGSARITGLKCDGDEFSAKMQARGRRIPRYNASQIRNMIIRMLKRSVSTGEPYVKVFLKITSQAP